MILWTILRVGVLIGVVTLALCGVMLTLAEDVPTGDQLAIEIRGDVLLLDVDRALYINLTHDSEPVDYPRWSPDGTRIAFIAEHYGTQQIQLLDMRYGTIQSLTLSDMVQYRDPPAWSPDGTQLVAQGWSEETRSIDINLINAQSGIHEVLVWSFTASEIDWSPDGTRIAIVSPGNEVYVVAVATGDLSRLTPGRNGFSIAWHESGEYVVYISQRSSNYDLYMTHVDGGDAIRLTDHPGMDFVSYKISLNDGRAAFVSHRDGNPEIYTLDLDSGDTVRLSDHPGTDWIPCWSPDGTRLAFMSSREGEPQLYVVDADGSSLRRISYGISLDYSGIPLWRPVRAG